MTYKKPYKKNILKYVLILTVLFTPLLYSVPVSAQNTNEDDLAEENQEAEVQSSPGLSAEFKEYTQDPRTKRVKFEMILKSEIDSDRVAVTWEVTGVSILADGYSERRNIAVQKGKTYVIPVEVIPVRKGVSEVFGKAQAFGAESSALATVRKNFASNSSGEVLPLTPEYESAKTTNLIVNIAVVSVIIILLLLFGLIGFKKFVKWYNTEDRK